MSAKVVKCRKGDPCRFEIDMGAPISADYTLAKFQARESFADTGVLLLEVDETTGITINHAGGLITVVIGATQTETLPDTTKPREVPAHIRLYNAGDADDRFSLPIPFLLLPDAIDD